MIIAIPYENGSVFAHFGRAEAFRFFDVTIETGSIVPGEIVSTEGAGHKEVAALLSDRGASLVICGGIGEGALLALQEQGLSVRSGASGTAEEAITAFLNGELDEAGTNCTHHSHGCGHGNADESEGSCCGHGNTAEDEGSCCGHGNTAEDEGSCCAHGSEAGGGCGGCGGGCGHGCGAPVEPIEGENAGKMVRVHYEGTFDDGSVFDSSYDRGEPLAFLCGGGQMIRGFDQAVANMKQGEIQNVHLEPEDAYGAYNPAAVMTFPIAELPGSAEIQVGARVHLQADDGRVLPVRVTAKDDELITLDANHEMAGKALNFKIELVEISK
jgi:FKBP-type peptidyl-prolyl cis-trans isomerase 2